MHQQVSESNKTKININRKQDIVISKPDYEIDIQEMIRKFETKTCTVEDASKYLEYFSYYKSSIKQLSLDQNNIKKALNKALGGLPTGALRTKLVDIEFLICPGL